jgi:hypothetical protein
LRSDATVPAGTVLEQTLVAETKVDPGSAVTCGFQRRRHPIPVVTVSADPTHVPVGGSADVERHGHG